jgi:probable HAF family extracellular repeat protein
VPPAAAFTLQDLGTLGGGSSTGADLNATGQVVGTSRTAGGADHAFLWDPTSRRMVDLGTLGVLRGTDYSFRSEATGVNDRGQVVGNSCSREDVYSCIGFLWDPTTRQMTDLGSPPSGWTDYPRPNAIDNQGRVVGDLEWYGASWWSPATGWQKIDDPAREDDGYGTAFDINELGQVAGGGSPTIRGPDTGEMEPYLFDLRTGHAAFRPDGCCGDIGPFAVNERSQVLGNGFPGDAPYVWNTISGTVSSLGAAATAADINESGQVVGTAAGHGFTWDPVTHTMTDLGTLGGATSDAAAVNDLGRIAGTSLSAAGQSRAVLWTPSAPSVVTVAVTASADTVVAQLAKSRNFGASVSLATRGSAGNALISYLRFPLPPAPAGRTLTGVTLQFRVVGDSFAGSVATQKVNLVSGAWTEMGTTYSNRPGLGPTLGSLAGAPARGTRYTIALDAHQVRGLLGKNLNIAMTGSSVPDSMWFNAHEALSASNRPQVTLTFGS